ncbi:DUF4139 domain-containing protein [Flammeovirga pacifica]|uniref:TonB-dependent receptor n=1 Tax=Flammeovirga pacifica TaxID=915059 RepID=A0A1S1YUN6_FLAPC|nr:DUF4139 domain-containing protein [Flammeovirga pacifica]OHX64573.1 hypothetical protein NH26_23665 [Flammeovirga pacifica]
MKLISHLSILLIIIPFTLIGQTVEKSTIEDVTVFTNAARINRTANAFVKKGNHELEITNLSKNIKDESIRVEGNNTFTILNVRYEKDYITVKEENEKHQLLKEKIDVLQEQINKLNLDLTIVSEELSFLKENKKINSTSSSSSDFQQYMVLYGNQLKKLSTSKYSIEKELKVLKEDLKVLQNQLRRGGRNTNKYQGKIIVTYESSVAKEIPLHFSYQVYGARWYPTYDIRTASAESKVNISFKANITQNTGIDWEGVKIKLSTAKQHVSGNIPTLYPNYIAYQKDVGQMLQDQVAGVEIQEEDDMGYLKKSSLNEVAMIRGTSVKDSNPPLYIVDGVPQKHNPNLPPEAIEEINILKDASSTAIYGSRGRNGVILVSTKKNGQSNKYKTLANKNRTALEFTLADKQNILSDNTKKTVIFKQNKVSADFEYNSVPKLSKYVYLTAILKDWEEIQLMSGQANIFLDNAYVGKTDIQTNNLSDSLNISFGVDNFVSVDREKLNKYEEKKTIGSSQKLNESFKITLKNNKSEEITCNLLDQIPVSERKEIQVEIIDLSGGKLNKNTGEVKWEVTLAPKEIKEVVIRYSVKYPKDKKIEL